MSKVTVVISKGGKGSGFYGHAGRPGLVGGSAPEAIATGLEIDYWIDGAGADVIENVSHDNYNTVLNALDNPMLRYEHIDGIKMITDEEDPDSDIKWEDEDGDVSDILGYYHSIHKEIHLNPGYRDRWKITLAHEIGHHVFENSPEVRTRIIKTYAEFIELEERKFGGRDSFNAHTKFMDAGFSSNALENVNEFAAELFEKYLGYDIDRVYVNGFLKTFSKFTIQEIFGE